MGFFARKADGHSKAQRERRPKPALCVYHLWYSHGFLINDCFRGVMKRGARNSEISKSDSVGGFHPARMRGASQLLAGVLGIAGALAACMTAIAAGGMPALRLQVPSS